MRYKEYSELIFEGLEYHKKYFEEYIATCLKKAATNFITDVEFLNRLVDVMKHYEGELLRRFVDQLKEFHNSLTIENIQNELKNGFPTSENTFIDLSNYSDNYKGKLGFEEIELIRKTILNIAKKQKKSVDVKPTSITDITKSKLQWKGTPGEFGAIFDELFDKGFIEVIKDKKNMVRFLHSIFEIKNEKDEIVDVEYLYKCFKDKKRSYNSSLLKIPFSDNYNKNK